MREKGMPRGGTRDTIENGSVLFGVSRLVSDVPIRYPRFIIASPLTLPPRLGKLAATFLFAPKS
jgi:hypothetical protein